MHSHTPHAIVTSYSHMRRERRPKCVAARHSHSAVSMCLYPASSAQVTARSVSSPDALLQPKNQQGSIHVH